MNLELKSSAYHAVHSTSHVIEYKFVQEALYSICRALHTYGEKAWVWEIRRLNSESTPEDLLRPINATIKTHKKYGEVKCRILHTACKGPFRALSKIAHIWLSEKLANKTHLCKDTADMLAKISAVRFATKTPVLVKMDVDNFYMAAEHEQLVCAVSSCFAGVQKDILVKILWTVLGFQFVQDRAGGVHRVMRGSGMGEVHSGALSDLAFWVIVEQHLNLGEHVTLYLRFRDDVLVVAESLEHAQNLVKQIQSRAKGCWTVSIDATSTYGVPMLDSLVYVGPRFKASGILDHAPYIKPTAVHVPLSSTSAHPRCIHENWPLGEVRRLRRLSLRDASFAYYRKKKLARWAYFFMDPEVLQKCATWQAPLIQQKSAKTCLGDVFRCVVRYHPGLAGLSRRLNNVCNSWQSILSHVGGLRNRFANIRVQVSNRMAARQLFALVR